ncbi:pilus assembly protein [Bordetella sp. 02P26C-1]|nr:pilus assembly protein [Bordetella sp. 02P26C-1]
MDHRGGEPARRLARRAIYHYQPCLDSARKTSAHPVWRLSGARRHERGAYVLEFALTFMALFFVLYLGVTYGLIMMAQQSLNLAAHDGARKALQWQGGANHMQLRANEALATVQAHADWIRDVSGAPLDVVVCGKDGRLSSAGDLTCSGETPASDELVVLVRYRYGAHPLAPKLAFIADALLPATLTARVPVRLSDLGAS